MRHLHGRTGPARLGERRRAGPRGSSAAPDRSPPSYRSPTWPLHHRRSSSRPRPRCDMTLVIDASVALKWVIEEEDSPAAMALLLGEPLAAPDFLAIECANVLWSKARRGDMSGQDARAGLAAILATPVQLLPSGRYVIAAQ